jgi:LPXTG-motif cell wall-anchored protein
VTVEGTTVTNPETLPVTGSSPWEAARLGVLMVLAGAAALALSRRKGVEA